MTYGQTERRATGQRTELTGILRTPLRARGRVTAAAALITAWVALLWVLEAVDVVAGHRLDGFGVVPRESGELLDIVPSPFIHFGFGHVASNSLPLLVLGFIAALRGTGRFLAVAGTVIVIAGLGVWLVAPAHTNTAGASGLVFGLFGYLLIRGFVDRRALDVVVGLIVGALYGSILWGVLPTANGVSWQGHLFGLMGGVAAAFLFRERTGAVSSGH